ncbi:hypothetical protein C8F01DRAFT_1135074 [Mycena amicta]|nr:hypothetical protein C8F01DRAFT_1135074 [Mycena amicta]
MSDPSLSPIHRVPPEVLGEIVYFFGTSRAGWNEHMELANVGKKALLTLAMVCSHWYNVVMHTPALWSEVEVHGRYWNLDSLVHFRALKRVLERSAQHPLAVILDLDSGSSYVPTLLQRLLGEHYTRIQSMDLAIDGGPLADRFLDNIFAKTPNLRHVALNFLLNHPIPRLPYAQLQSLTFKDNGTVDFIDILPKLPLGAKFTFHYIAHTWLTHLLSWDNVPAELKPFPRVTSPITRLHLELSAAPNPTQVLEFTGRLLDCLTLPNLTTLAFERRSFPAFWPGPEFTMFSQRSALGNTLRVLDVHRMLLTPNALLGVLADLSALEELMVADHPLHNAGPGAMYAFTDVLFRRLTLQHNLNSPSPAGLVPRLHHLTCISLFTFTPAAYRDFIGSRCGVLDSGVVFKTTFALAQGVKGTERERAKGNMGDVFRILQPLVEEKWMRLYRK